MGREYAAEIAQLGSTIQAAAEKPLAREEVDAFRAALAHPLVAIGVGGSTVAAAYAAKLHRQLVGAPARVATTLEFTTEGPARGESALLVSAGGRNKDVLAACDVAIELCRELSIWTANIEAPLSVRAREAGFPSIIDTYAGVKKDGYLATNTLLSTLIVGLRLYYQAIGAPLDAEVFAHLESGIDTEGDRLADESDAWKNVDDLLVLYDGWGQVGAVDLETRLHEAGLLPVQTADLRSFAHGRHLWMARRPRTGVVTLVDASSVPLLNRTLKLLPDETPVIRCQSKKAAPIAGIEHTLSTLLLTDALSRRAGVDPGRPSVPDWGRKIYGLGPARTRKERVSKQPVAHEVSGDLTALAWHKSAVTALQNAVIRGLVLDLDGTLLERRDRMREPELAFFDELNRLAREGLVIGFASGRGRSLYDCLHRHMAKESANKVVLGYYNGGVIRSLADGDLVGVRNEANGDLSTFLSLLQAHQGPTKWFKAEVKEHQINVSAVNPGDARRLAELSLAIIDAHTLHLRGASSSLGLDVFPGNSSKLRVVEAVAKLGGATPDEVLRIGDRGDNGGNDYLMLNHPLGLSVDRTNPRQDACWALVPAGVRGTRAALQYLRALRPRGKNGGHLLALEG